MRLAQLFTAGAVSRPDTCSQAVLGIICQAHRFVIAVECHHRENGTKSFVAHDSHAVRHVGEDGRLIKILSQVWKPRPSGQNPCAASDGIFHVIFHDSQLPLMNHRANIGVWV